MGETSPHSSTTCSTCLSTWSAASTGGTCSKASSASSSSQTNYNADPWSSTRLKALEHHVQGYTRWTLKSPRTSKKPLQRDPTEMNFKCASERAEWISGTPNWAHMKTSPVLSLPPLAGKKRTNSQQILVVYTRPQISPSKDAKTTDGRLVSAFTKTRT